MRQELFTSRGHALVLLSLPVAASVLAAARLVELGPRAPDPGLNDPDAEVLRALCVAALAISALLVGALAPGLVRRSPALVIDDEGLLEPGALGAGRVRWADVTGVRVVSLTREYVALDLADVDAFLEGAPLLRRVALRGAMLMGYPPVTIAGRALGVDTRELARTIEAARAAAHG